LFLGESVTLMQLAGGALTISALAMMSLSRGG